MRRLPLLLFLISTAAVWAAIGDAAHAQILRRGIRRCIAPQHRFSTNSLSVGPVGAAVPLTKNPTSHEQELKQMVAILPDYTRCIVVCRQPAILGADDIERLDARGRTLKESIESLDRDPGKAFGQYLQALTGVGLANRAPNDLSEFFQKGQIRLIVGGQANYHLPQFGPAGVTQSDSVNICVYERPLSETWRQITQKRSQHIMSVLHREGDVEFFQEGKICVAFAPPNVVIFGDKYSYFHDVVKNAARRVQSPPTARNFIDLVDPAATFWFAYFSQKKSALATSWPVHVVEYAPNDDWSLTMWSGALGLASRPKRDSTENYEDFETELIPGSDNAGRKLKPLIAKGWKYGRDFDEMRFSLRDYDMESGAFPIVFLGLMGIAVFI